VIDTISQLGWSIAAQTIGSVFNTTFALYRPGYNTVLSGYGNLINPQIPGYVTYNAYQKGPLPLDPTKPRVHLVFDPAQVQPGDYLIGSMENNSRVDVFFVATNQSPAPISGVHCNAVVNVSRAPMPPASTAGFGVIQPLDTQIGNEQILMSGWPASVIREGRGQTGDVGLPDDDKLGGFIIMLPPSVPMPIRSGDVITNTAAPDNVRMVVVMAERTNDAWRLLAQEATS
jgi:hypothetical protein